MTSKLDVLILYPKSQASHKQIMLTNSGLCKLYVYNGLYSLDTILRRGIIKMGDNMRLIVMFMIIVMVVAGCTSNEIGAASADNINHPLQLAEGETCLPYTPSGQVVYESEWTGEYPEIEKYDKAYATATFGMG